MIKKFLKEFKEFAMKGNVFDMAIGIIIGGSFSKIVTSLVNDLIMPIFGFLIGSTDLSKLEWTVQKWGTTDADNLIHIKYGSFLSTVVDFIIIAFSIFTVVKLINKLKKKNEPKPAENKPAPPTQEQLLAEIRDLLREQHDKAKEKE